VTAKTEETVVTTNVKRHLTQILYYQLDEDFSSSDTFSNVYAAIPPRLARAFPVNVLLLDRAVPEPGRPRGSPAGGRGREQSVARSVAENDRACEREPRLSDRFTRCLVAAPRAV
jgi:hypothetical protein